MRLGRGDLLLRHSQTLRCHDRSEPSAPVAPRQDEDCLSRD